MDDFTKKPGTAVVLMTDDEELLNYANAISQKTIVGKLLTFQKGDWVAGRNDEEELIPLGTVVAVNFDAMIVGHVRWEDGKPVEQIMAPVTKVRTLPKRADLGYLDKQLWEPDQDGNPRDPWQWTNYLPMQRMDTGEICTFATGTKTGQIALGNLLRVYLTVRKKHPDDHLTVSLQVGSFPHKNRAIGRVKIPQFDIVGRTPKAPFTEALMNAGVFLPEPNVPEPVPQISPPLKDELNDEIPTFEDSPEPSPAEAGGFGGPPEPPPAEAADFDGSFDPADDR